MFTLPHQNTRQGVGRILQSYANPNLVPRAMGEALGTRLMQIRDIVLQSSHNCPEFLPALLVFRWGYVSTEKAQYCLTGTPTKAIRQEFPQI